MRKSSVIMAIALVFSLLVSAPAYSGEIDILVEKLVEKGILSHGEAQQILTETREEVKREIASGKSASVPAWVQNIKLKGDFRLRYQNEVRKGSNNNTSRPGRDNSIERNRGRIRLRLGAEAKVNDQLKAFIGLATGGTDPRSTNQTFENTFELKDIRLDYAYAKYYPLGWLTLYGGRMKNPLWEPSDMLWDTDISPEGVAVALNKNIGSNLNAYLNSSVFILDEFSNSSDPWMYAFQPGLKWKLNDKVSLNSAVAFYGFQQVEGATMDNSSGSNTRVLQNTASSKKYDFDSINPGVELKLIEPSSLVGLSLPIDIPYMAIFGEAIYNYSVRDEDSSHTGHALGLKLGHEKVDDWKKWQLKYAFVNLGTDAWLDNLPDSDRYGGRTGVKSHEIVLSYGLGKNWTFDLDYYHSDLYSAANMGDDTAQQEDLFQADLNFKF